MSVSNLELLKKNKCFCLKKQKVIRLSECNITECHREKGCRKSINNKIEKEMQDGRKSKKKL